MPFRCGSYTFPCCRLLPLNVFNAARKLETAKEQGGGSLARGDPRATGTTPPPKKVTPPSWVPKIETVPLSWHVARTATEVVPFFCSNLSGFRSFFFFLDFFTDSRSRKNFYCDMDKVLFFFYV